MPAPVAYAGLAVASFAVGSRAKKKAEEERRKQMIKAAWMDYGASAFEFDRSREQQRQFHAQTMDQARAKLGASGVRPGTTQWKNIIGKYERENRQALVEIEMREQKWRESQNYLLAKSTYDTATSVSRISQDYGLKGFRSSAAKGRRDNHSFRYETYDYSDPLIPGYVGHTTPRGRGSRAGKEVYEPFELTTEYISRNPRRPAQPGDRRQAKIVSRGFYEAARPTMDEFYWIHYSGDKEKAAEAQTAIRQRTDEYLATYGSIIAMGPYEGVTGPDRKTKIMK